jgi:hypothetical protein
MESTHDRVSSLPPRARPRARFRPRRRHGTRRRVGVALARVRAGDARAFWILYADRDVAIGVAVTWRSTRLLTARAELSRRTEEFRTAHHSAPLKRRCPPALAHRRAEIEVDGCVRPPPTFTKIASNGSTINGHDTSNRFSVRPGTEAEPAHRGGREDRRPPARAHLAPERRDRHRHAQGGARAHPRRRPRARRRRSARSPGCGATPRRSRRRTRSSCRCTRTAHAEREQLVRDLAPALDVITDVFNRARQMRDALAPSSRPYIPPPSAASIDALIDYREAPVEAHHGE